MSLVCSRGSQAHHKVQNTPSFSPRILDVSHTERVVKMFPMEALSKVQSILGTPAMDHEQNVASTPLQHHAGIE